MENVCFRLRVGWAGLQASDRDQSPQVCVLSVDQKVPEHVPLMLSHKGTRKEGKERCLSQSIADITFDSASLAKAVTWLSTSPRVSDNYTLS